MMTVAAVVAVAVVVVVEGKVSSSLQGLKRFGRIPRHVLYARHLLGSMGQCKVVPIQRYFAHVNAVINA